MKPLPEAVLAPNIQAALDVVEQAKAGLRAAIIDSQAHCEHRIVSEVPWSDSGLPAMRVCNHCRFTEEGSHWSGGATWSRHDFGKSDLGNVDGRLVQPVKRDQFYRMRINP